MLAGANHKRAPRCRKGNEWAEWGSWTDWPYQPNGDPPWVPYILRISGEGGRSREGSRTGMRCACRRPFSDEILGQDQGSPGVGGSLPSRHWPLSPSCAPGEEGYGPVVPNTRGDHFYLQTKGTLRGPITPKVAYSQHKLPR